MGRHLSFGKRRFEGLLCFDAEAGRTERTPWTMRIAIRLPCAGGPLQNLRVDAARALKASGWIVPAGMEIVAADSSLEP